MVFDFIVVERPVCQQVRVTQFVKCPRKVLYKVL